jgi:hypothetical protein
MVVIAPFTLFWSVLLLVLPKIDTLYFNNVTLVRKKG